MSNFVVTGSTKGIGLAIVKAIINKYQDAKVFMTYGHDDNAAKICKELYGDSVDIKKVDLSSYSEMHDYCDYVKSNINDLYALILNAGIGYKAPLEELDIEKWEQVMRINVSVPIFMIKEMLPILKRGSSVVMAGSIMGNIPHSGSLAYGVSKSAVWGG